MAFTPPFLPPRGGNCFSCQFKRIFYLPLIFFVFCSVCSFAQSALVLQSDFGTKDGAVAAMKGVANGVDARLNIFDLTHEIPPFNIWEAAYRLNETAKYWPVGTVFVSVVDPGVGTSRKSVVLKTNSGYFFVTPDNGTLTLIAESMGIAAIREIDEKINRLPGSEKSYTFHGRDVYAFTGARLASGKITFEQVGPLLPAKVESIPYQKAGFENGVVSGTIPILDVQFGNIWTNIDEQTWQMLEVKKGDVCAVRIVKNGKMIFSGEMPFVSSFGHVKIGAPLLYLNSQLHLSMALNQDSFAEKYGISSGPVWKVEVRKAK
jgi:S-adenosylmethionine hydrolase